MSDFFRWAVVIALVLLVPIIPFLSFGDSLEAAVERWMNDSLSPLMTATVAIAALASDILLPIPSSFVSTLVGSRLGFLVGAAVVWVGMTVGAVIGFTLARVFGRPLAARLSREDDLARMETVVRERGGAMLAITRALPVLAEATVLLCGAIGMPWSRFLAVVSPANLGLSAAYAALGYYAGQEGNLAVALAASIALPLAGTVVAQHLLPVERRSV